MDLPQIQTCELLKCIDARGDEQGMIDLTGLDVSPVDLAQLPTDDADPQQRRILREVKFGSRKTKPAVIGGLDFRKLILRDCSFCGVVFDGTDLRGAKLDKCDFRYAQFFRATLQDSQIIFCDFYRAFFQDGTIFDPAIMEGSSFTRAYLSGIVELQRQNLRPARRGAAAPLAQELKPQQYADFLVATAPDRFERNPDEELSRAERVNRADDLISTVNARHEEAAIVLRRIAALWTSQGAYAFAGWAYVRGKRKERRHLNPFKRRYSASLVENELIRVRRIPEARKEEIDLKTGTKRSWRPDVFARRAWTGWTLSRSQFRSDGRSFLGEVRRAARWVLMLLADALCAFGEGLGHVLFWVFALVLIPGIVYSATHSVEETASKHAAGLWDSMLFALTELVNASPGRLHAATSTVETFTAIQTLIGIVLLGLLGFVLGNKLHSA